MEEVLLVNASERINLSLSLSKLENLKLGFCCSLYNIDLTCDFIFQIGGTDYTEECDEPASGIPLAPHLLSMLSLYQ